MTTIETGRATDLDRLCVDTIRMLAIDAVEQAKSGHPGTPMALAPIGYVLYTRVMRHSPEHPDWPNRDRFVLSAGHASMLLYALLYLTGYGLTLEDIKRFRQLGSPCAGHPEYGLAPGIEATTGPLGQGLGACVGLALGERMLNARLGDDVIDHHTFAIASDGDMQEGIASEAASLAGHLGLSRLVVFYDDNHITIEGDTSLAFSEERGRALRGLRLARRCTSARTSTSPRIESAAWEAMDVDDRPSLIVCRTHIAPGAPTKHDTPEAHGSPLGEEEVRRTKEAYGWPTEPAVLRARRGAGAHARVRRARARAGSRAGRQRSGGWSGVRGCPTGWDAGLPTLRARRQPDAWRHPQGRRRGPAVGGARPCPTSSAARPTSRPRRCRSSATAATSQRGALRRAQPALRHPRARDGRGRQRARPQRAARLRLDLPHLQRLHEGLDPAGLAHAHPVALRLHARLDRPGRGRPDPPARSSSSRACAPSPTSTSCARPTPTRPRSPSSFALAQERHAHGDRPHAPGLPVIGPEGVPDDAVERGAYVLHEAERPLPDAILMASGSEVHAVPDAAALLRLQGIEARVVSMPCMERFEEQDRAYRDEVLLPGVRARVCVEALSPLRLAALRRRRRRGDRHVELRRQRPRRRAVTSTSASPPSAWPRRPAQRSRERGAERCRRCRSTSAWPPSPPRARASGSTRSAAG